MPPNALPAALPYTNTLNTFFSLKLRFDHSLAPSSWAITAGPDSRKLAFALATARTNGHIQCTGQRSLAVCFCCPRRRHSFSSAATSLLWPSFIPTITFCPFISRKAGRMFIYLYVTIPSHDDLLIRFSRLTDGEQLRLVGKEASVKLMSIS